MAIAFTSAIREESKRLDSLSKESILFFENESRVSENREEKKKKKKKKKRRSEFGKSVHAKETIGRDCGGGGENTCISFGISLS